jgi:hypothetical protein
VLAPLRTGEGSVKNIKNSTDFINLTGSLPNLQKKMLKCSD